MSVPRFLIEATHEAETVACAKVVQVFLATGSHFLTNADWGCMDGDHRALIIVEANDHEEARCVLPPAFRADARVTRLSKFTMEQIQRTLAKHGHHS